MTLRSRMKNPIVVNMPNDEATVSVTDDYGNETVELISTEYWVEMQQQSSSEQEVNRHTRTQQWFIVGPPEMIIDSRATITWEDGNEAEHNGRVMGEPLLARTGRGDHHYEIQMEEVLG